MVAETPVAILAGGRATRLGALASHQPKALVTVAGRPFIDHQLSLLRRRGFRQVVLCVGHLSDQIVAHVADGARFGLTVRYSRDDPFPLGTGGAIRQAAPLLGPLFWVVYGDAYLDFDYDRVLRHFLRRRAPALMTVHRNRDRWDHSNVRFAAGWVLAYDKERPQPEMEHIDFGATLMRRPALSRLPPTGPCDLANLFRELALEGQLAGYEVTRRFYEVGSPRGLEETSGYLRTSGSGTAASLAPSERRRHA